MSLLDQMARSSRVRCEEARAARPLEALIEEASALPAPRPLVLHPVFDLLAEVKLRAPSAGQLAAPRVPVRHVVRQTQTYADAGAAAISVLTEPERFDGQLSYLAAAAARVETPLMRKDFLVDPYQVWEARLSGASGVLLIVRMLDDEALDAMLQAAREAGIFALVECFDRKDLQRLAGREVALVGVNSRDLKTLKVVPDRLVRLAAHLPEGCIGVAESGMETPADIREVVRVGYRMALVGSALMRAGDPLWLSEQMLEAGRACG